jgi:hypothetical protein
MFRSLLRSLVLLSLLAASPVFAMDYQPSIWPLRDGLIPAFDAAGQIEVVNAQPVTDEVIVYKYGVKWNSNYNLITDTMAQQIRDEIAKNGRPLDGPAKRIEVKVVHLLSKYKFFYWNSVIRYEVRLGNGEAFEKEVPHGSGNPLQDLNGCIAEGVMVLLNDAQVRTYLSAANDGDAPASDAAEGVPAGSVPAASVPAASTELANPSAGL